MELVNIFAWSTLCIPCEHVPLFYGEYLQHICGFCSSYGNHRDLWVRPFDQQSLIRWVLRKVEELDPEVVEVQGEFDPLDPPFYVNTIHLVSWLLARGYRVKLFTHLLRPTTYIVNFIDEVTKHVGSSLQVVENLEIHTSIHALDMNVLKWIWVKTYERDGLLGIIYDYHYLIKNILMLRGMGFKIGAHFVVTSVNIREIFNVYMLCNYLGIEQLSFLRLAPQGLALETWNIYAPTVEEWVLIYSKFLRLMRAKYYIETGIIVDQLFKEYDRIRSILENRYGLKLYRFPIQCRDWFNLTVPRFGCPINWFFILRDSETLRNENDIVLKLIEKKYQAPKCSAVTRSGVSIDVGGYMPCIGFKDWVRCRDLKELDRFRTKLAREYVAEECRSCKYFTTCLGKCFAQKWGLGVKVDPLCRIVRSYKEEIARRSLNKYNIKL